MRSLSLTRIIPWSHSLLAEVLERGDLAVDMTAGNGHDTLFLARQVGPAGHVIAFDVQPSALDRTAARLADADVSSRRIEEPGELQEANGVTLVHASHSRLGDYLTAEPKAVIANLGYLPGGDRSLVTRPPSTLEALTAALERLAVGGRLAVVVYVGHPGGVEEAEAVETLFSSLPSESWQVLNLEAANRPQAPYLLVAQKSAPCRSS